MTITWHVILHAVAHLLREIRLALQDTVPLRVRAVVTQLPLSREKALPFPLRYGHYCRIGGRYPWSYDHPGLLTRGNRERKIGDLRCLDGTVKQHLRNQPSTV